MTDGLRTSKTDEWETPQSIFYALDAEFHFDLDPASTDQNAKCERHYKKEDDGLTKNWGGGVECSAILRMVGRSVSGCGRDMRNPGSQGRLWSCFCRREQTRPGSMTTVCKARSVSSGGDFGSGTANRMRLSHQW